MAMHDPEDAQWWYRFGADKAKEFAERVAPKIGLSNTTLNPDKKIDYNAPALIVGGVLSAIKTQETPFFKARKYYGIDPQYAFSFNQGDYLLYKDKYPDLPIYVWINWLENEKF